MHRLIPLSTLLACGPLAPPADLSSTSDETTTTTTTATTAPLPDPTTTTTTTATTTTGEPTTTASTTNLPGFIIMPDTPTIEECDVWSQNCPPGDKCTAWAEGGGGAWNATKCVKVTGDGAPGEPCTVVDSGVSGIDDCALGAMCWYLDQTNHGTCIALCTGSAATPECPIAHFCYQAADGALNLCFSNCDPILQDCPGDDLCIPVPDGQSFFCVLDASGDLGKQNDPCEYANACDPGLVCAAPALASECDPMAAGCCLPFCDLTNPDCTNQGAMCLPWYEMNMAPPGYENVGVCGLMQ